MNINTFSVSIKSSALHQYVEQAMQSWYVFNITLKLYKLFWGLQLEIKYIYGVAMDWTPEWPDPTYNMARIVLKITLMDVLTLLCCYYEFPLPENQFLMLQVDGIHLSNISLV